MRRQGHLIEKIAEIENLQSAYYKAKKGKGARQEVYEYGKRLHENLTRLRRQILTGEVEIGNYRYFFIFDPKKRLICEAPFGQRVLHHALMNVCHPFFERVQIFDSYASRPGKGTYAALDRAKYFNTRYHWFLKLDFRKYFDSIDHTLLKAMLSKIFKDRRLLAIFESIIDSYSVDENKGLPIGNLTSQYFANHYLTRLDHYVKEVLQLKAYLRYMDDLVVWHDDKQALKNIEQRLSQYAERDLALTFKPVCLNRNLFGLPFLGYLLYADHVRLAHRSRVRFVAKLKLYEANLSSGLWNQNEYQKHILPLIAFTEHAQAKEYRKSIIAAFT